MGLDMYLYAKKLVTPEVTKEKALDDLGDWIEVGDIKDPWWDTDNDTVVAVILGSWRKANEIHKWFVDNVQGGEDQCNAFPVTPEHVDTLLALCKEVLADHDKAEDLLPTQDGFFFGSLDYDEWYFKSLTHTVRLLETVKIMMAQTEPADVIVEYQSSW